MTAINDVDQDPILSHQVLPVESQAGCAASTEHENIPQLSSFPHIFSCVPLPNKKALNDPVTVWSWPCWTCQ